MHWAWKLRDQKRRQDRDNSCENLPAQESKELLELYAAELEHGNKMETAGMKFNNKEPVKDVT